MRTLAIAAAVAGLLASACRAAPPGATALILGPGRAVLTIRAGETAPGGREVTGFLPSLIRARPGDTIRFQNGTLGTPHTVSSGFSDRVETWPAALLDGARPNPARVSPCVAAGPPAGDAADCPTPTPITAAGGSGLQEPFAGQGVYNAGVVHPGTTLSLTLSPTLLPGPFVFRCLIHAGMTVTVDVVAPSARVPGQAAIDQAAQREAEAALRTARPVAAPVGAAAAVNVGGTGKAVTVDQFAPASVTVRSGALVTWHNFGPFPHTITFGLQPPGFDAATSPASGPDGADYRGGYAYSGWVAAAAGRPTFSLRFTSPGRYPFRCSFHPGMLGVVIVR